MSRFTSATLRHRQPPFPPSFPPDSRHFAYGTTGSDSLFLGSLTRHEVLPPKYRQSEDKRHPKGVHVEQSAVVISDRVCVFHHRGARAAWTKSHVLDSRVYRHHYRLSGWLGGADHESSLGVGKSAGSGIRQAHGAHFIHLRGMAWAHTGMVLGHRHYPRLAHFRVLVVHPNQTGQGGHVGDQWQSVCERVGGILGGGDGVSG